MIECLIVLLALAILFLLSLRGRKHPGLAQLRGHVYAHRGLHNADLPENSLAAFQAAVEHGYGMELDVHLTKDGSLAVIHDSPLKRTTGKEGRVEDLTGEELAQTFLEGTDQHIPTLQQVLELVGGRVPLIIEVKPVDNNYAPLTQAVCDLLDTYQGIYCLESFDPRAIRWLKKNRPGIIRGQLAENFLHVKGSVPWFLKFLLTYQMLNFLTSPDFTAYRYAHRQNIPTWLVRKFWGIQGVSWTLRTKEEFDTAVVEGWLPIFENFTP